MTAENPINIMRDKGINVLSYIEQNGVVRTVWCSQMDKLLNWTVASWKSNTSGANSVIIFLKWIWLLCSCFPYLSYSIKTGWKPWKCHQQMTTSSIILSCEISLQNQCKIRKFVLNFTDVSYIHQWFTAAILMNKNFSL